jgi:hypothetical protein
MALFHDENGPTALRYRVQCDRDWRSTRAEVDGWWGARTISLRIQRAEGGNWTLNGVPSPSVTGCIDLDLSFTPATNLLPLRRLNLAVTQSAEVRSAWLEWPEAKLTRLVQRYTRRSVTEYDYEADLPDTAKFGGRLRVEPGGWVTDYAGLWQAEADNGTYLEYSEGELD